MNVALSFRQKLLTANELGFSTKITADFDDEVFIFNMDCSSQKAGDILFSVTYPTSIAGITGKITADAGELIFDDKILAFPLIIEDSISPISGPWIFMNCLRNGYLSSCGETNDGLQIIISDTISGENIQCLLWLNKDNLPYYSEIIWRGRRVLSLEIENIMIL